MIEVSLKIVGTCWDDSNELEVRRRVKYEGDNLIDRITISLGGVSLRNPVVSCGA